MNQLIAHKEKSTKTPAESTTPDLINKLTVLVSKQPHSTSLKVYNIEPEKLVAHRRQQHKKTTVIKDQIEFDEVSTEVLEDQPNIFSIYMDEIPEYILPAIRCILAFIWEEKSDYLEYKAFQKILQELEWKSEDISEDCLLKFAIQRTQLKKNIERIAQNPLKYVSNQKRKTIKTYMEEHKEAFEMLEWKKKVFDVAFSLYTVMIDTMKFLDEVNDNEREGPTPKNISKSDCTVTSKGTEEYKILIDTSKLERNVTIDVFTPKDGGRSNKSKGSLVARDKTSDKKRNSSKSRFVKKEKKEASEERIKKEKNKQDALKVIEKTEKKAVVQKSPSGSSSGSKLDKGKLGVPSVASRRPSNTNSNKSGERSKSRSANYLKKKV